VKKYLWLIVCCLLLIQQGIAGSLLEDGFMNPRLEIGFSIHASDGWANTGGPWIAPENAMQAGTGWECDKLSKDGVQAQFLGIRPIVEILKESQVLAL
jgi:hypothetical protein